MYQIVKYTEGGKDFANLISLPKFLPKKTNDGSFESSFERVEPLYTCECGLALTSANVDSL
jgi:hypothetical protein